MKTKSTVLLILSMMIILTVHTNFHSFGQEIAPAAVIQLENPDFSKGMPVMQALKERKSNRNIADTPLSLKQFSELLWAANGQNRDDGKRTAPSAMNRQMVDIYVIMKEGVYLFKPAEHQLVLKVAGDYRNLAGGQPFVKTAPVNLIFIADFAKWKTAGSQPSREELVSYSGIEAGCQAQNVYLYCASEGLAVVVRASVNKEEVSKLLGLTPDQFIVAGQTVGLPI